MCVCVGGGVGDPIIFLHESTRGVEQRLHTENQRPRCLGSVLKVCVVGVGWVDKPKMLWPKASPLDLCFVPGPSYSTK